MPEKEMQQTTEPKTDSTTKTKATNPTVAADIAMLGARNQELEKQTKIHIDEIKDLKTQLQEANARIDAAIRTALYPQITSKMNITKAQLDEMEPKELHELNQTLNAIKGDMAPRGRPNVIGSDSLNPRITIDRMPNLYGKKVADPEVLKQLGA